MPDRISSTLSLPDRDRCSPVALPAPGRSRPTDRLLGVEP